MKLALSLAGAALFLVLATANSGGYRYGVSDQAYYAAAVLKARTPALFPRDSPLLAAESRFMVSDTILGALSRDLGVSLPSLFLVAQVVTLLVLLGAGAAFCRALGFSWWATGLFLALLTLRHHITKTGANTLEGYMHPRVLAFAFGLLALTSVLRRRVGLAVVILIAAAAAHPTTAVWFGVATGTAIYVDRPAWRRRLLAVAAALTLVALWALTAGPLAGRLTTMDPAWLAVLADRDYLFPATWPLYAWAINLGYCGVLWLIWRCRQAEGATVPGETALMAGWAALVVVFLASVPFSAAHLALAVQAQVDRVFWLLDVGATAALAWWIMSRPLAATGRRRALILSAVLVLSAGRGWYVLTIANPRPLVAVDLPAGPWTATMTWLGEQPATWNVLTDPGHAWKYGSSVRVAAGRDTVLDASKDPALAMYDRSIAERVAVREAALQNFPALSTAEMVRLGHAFAADVVIAPVSQPLALPVLFRNDGFAVYDVR